jgi:hypothetical protein
MEWLYAADQRQVGPLSEAEFARLVGAGTIGAKALVWRPGMLEWRPWELVSAEAPSGADALSRGGAVFAVRQRPTRASRRRSPRDASSSRCATAWRSTGASLPASSPRGRSSRPSPRTCPQATGPQ